MLDVTGGTGKRNRATFSLRFDERASCEYNDTQARSRGGVQDGFTVAVVSAFNWDRDDFTSISLVGGKKWIPLLSLLK